MSTTAAVADQKIAILNNFENITKNAANALLKVLEDASASFRLLAGCFSSLFLEMQGRHKLTIEVQIYK